LKETKIFITCVKRIHVFFFLTFC